MRGPGKRQPLGQGVQHRPADVMRRVVVAAAGIADADQDLHRHAALGQSCHCLVLRDRRLPCRWLTPLHLRAQLAAGSAKQVLAAIHAPARDRLQPMMREPRSEEHTSELQSLMRISYAVFCLKKKTKKTPAHTDINTKSIH